MLATVAAADSVSTVRKKYSVFIYSEAEPYAMYAIYKQTRTLCVLQFITFWSLVLLMYLLVCHMLYNILEGQGSRDPGMAVMLNQPCIGLVI